MEKSNKKFKSSSVLKDVKRGEKKRGGILGKERKKKKIKLVERGSNSLLLQRVKVKLWEKGAGQERAKKKYQKKSGVRRDGNFF